MTEKILTCVNCNSGCLWLYSAVSESANGTDRGCSIIAASIKSNYAMGIWIGYTCVRDVCNRDSCAKCAFVEGIELGVLVKLRLTLADPRINDYCFWLFMRLFFTSIVGVSCWDTWKLNSDSRSIHFFDVEYIFLYLRKSFLS